MQWLCTRIEHSCPFKESNIKSSLKILANSLDGDDTWLCKQSKGKFPALSVRPIGIGVFSHVMSHANRNNCLSTFLALFYNQHHH